MALKIPRVGSHMSPRPCWKGGVTHVPHAPLEGAYSHSFSRRKLRTHTVYQEDADHLHSLLYSPNYRPDLCHVNPRMSSL